MLKGDEYQLSYKQIKMIIDILNVDNKLLTLSSLARLTNVSIHYDCYRKVIKILLEHKIIVKTQKFGAGYLIQIHKKKLKNFIDEQVEINYLVDKFLKPYHTFIW